MNGTVSDFCSVRGFGFLTDEERDEYCFYTGDVMTAGLVLQKGDRITFDLYKGRGTRAVNVSKENKTSPTS